MIVTITEPKIKIVQIGQEVTLRCNVDTQGQVRQYLKLFSKYYNKAIYHCYK